VETTLEVPMSLLERSSSPEQRALDSVMAYRLERMSGSTDQLSMWGWLKWELDWLMLG